MSERTCQTCGGPLKWWPGKPGARPKFCSDKCRKASYGSNCVDCGTRTNGSNGRARTAVRCAECDKKLIRNRAQARFKDKNDRIAELYLAGMPLKDVAVEMGLTAHALRVAVQRLRRNYGYDLPYRRTPRKEPTA